MREIIFRAKEEPYGGWVEGYLVGQKHIGNWPECKPIDPETVGQYTGMTDKNGKRIFEGDILRYTQPEDSNAYGLVKFCEYGCGGTHNVGFNIDWFGRYFTGWLRTDIGFWIKYREIEVIGNIHDNPELLEEV